LFSLQNYKEFNI